MNTQDQRKDGVKLAVQLNATKTLELIKDDTKGIEAILQSAVAEVGLDKLASVILESDYSYWALGALRYIPNLGKYEAPLREKAGIVALPKESAGKLASKAGDSLQSIDTFEMYIACGAGYVANFTMWYFTPPFSNQWTQSATNTGSKVPVCKSQTEKCTYFSNSDAPLQTGDTVMMVVGIAGNKDWQPTNIWFTYDPTNLYTAEIDCHGQTLNPSFTWSVKND
ncbi:MAG: hypothetical protein WCC92_03410 [Candidatus Korobacteraceae bacterium]